MSHRNRRPVSSRFQSRNNTSSFDRNHFDNSWRNDDFDRSEFNQDSDYKKSELRFEDKEFGHDREQLNRYGEGRILRDYYDDKTGMRHARTENNRHEFNWSRDPRSQASAESHAGKGPKGYRRSDGKIHEDICELLTHHHDLDASEIEVEVRDGMVTLSGTVMSRREKRLAEELADDIRGVVDVHNRIQFSLGHPSRVPGSDVVSSQLEANKDQ